MGATSSPEHTKPAYVIAAPNSAGHQEVFSPDHRKDREEDRGDRAVHCLRRLEVPTASAPGYLWMACP